ncbi:hypothetical protein Droror1_Dr00002071 [Drosera rotundifolia]
MEEEGSENCMSWQERVYWSHFQTTQFCQILPRDFNHHLVIPKKFAGNMWHRLPTKALLKSPNGGTWKVELKGDGDELRFLDGWGEFVKACSLKENDLLIFKYSGNSDFDVLIFNLESLCEKESVYFIRKCGCAKPNSGSQQERDKWIVVQDQIHDFGSIPSKRPRKYSSQEPIVMEQTNDRVQQNARTQYNFLSRIDDHDGVMPAAVGSPAVQQNTSNENEELDIQAPLSVQRSAPEDNGRTSTGCIQASVESGGEQGDVDAGSSLMRPNNPSVVEHDALKETEILAIQTPNSIQLSALEDNGSTPSETPLTSVETGCTRRKRSARKSSNLTRLKGLIVKKSTSEGNKVLSIQALTSVQESALRDDESTPRGTPYTPAESSVRQRKRKLVASSSSKGNKVWSIQALTSVQESALIDDESTPRGTPYTPAESSGRQRKRKLVASSSSKGNKVLSIQALTSVQESAFIDDESTPRGIPYTPAESSGRQRKRKLVASSSSAKPNNPSAKSSPLKYASNRRAITEEEKAKAIKMAEQEFTDGSFMVIMPPSAVYKRFFMSIPADWVFKHSHHPSQVTLRIGTKTWTTRFFTGKGRTGGLSSGWKNFALDNCLEQFDVCLFKPSGNDEQGIILDVSIFRVVPEVEPLSLVF